MDVEMPDGTIIEGVPEGTTKAQLQAKLNAKKAPPREAPGAAPLPSYGDTMKRSLLNLGKGLVMGGPMGAVGAGVNEAMQNAQTLMDRGAYNAGGAVTDMTGSPAAGFATNVGVQAIPTVLGAALGKSAGQQPTKALAERLMQSAVKPQVGDIESGAAKRAITTMLDEGVNATSGGMEKLHKNITGLDQQVKQLIAASPERVGVAEVGQALRRPMDAARTQVNPQKDMAAVRAAWDEFRKHPDLVGKTDMPVQLAQELKRGTYAALGKKSYGEVGSAATESQKALAHGLLEGVSKRVPETVPLLKRESDLMNVLSVAERRALMEANKNPAGLALLTHDPYAFAGFMADKSAAFKSILARMLYQGQGVIPTTAGAVVGADIGNRSGASK